MSVLVSVRAQFANSETRMPTTTRPASTTRVRANRTGAAPRRPRRSSPVPTWLQPRRDSHPRAPSSVTKSISSSTRPSSAGSRSAYDATRAEDVLPGAGDVGLVAVRPAERLADALLPLDVARDVRPGARCPSRSGFTACPDVDERVADDQHVLADRGLRRRRAAIRLSLEPGTRWSTSTPTRRSGPGRKSRRCSARSSTPLEVLHDHALDPQVVAPDLLDQLGVVAALDEDPAGPGHPGLGAGHGDRPGRRTRGRRRAPPRARGDAGSTGTPSSRKPGPSGKVRRLPRRSSRVTRAEVAVDRDDLAAPVGGDLLDDQPERRRRSRRRGRASGARQSVASTSVP